MTSFATAFASLEQEKASSMTTAAVNSQPAGSNQFSSIDLDQQINASPPSVSSEEQHSSYVSLSDAVTLRTEPPSSSNHLSRVPPSSSHELSPNYSTGSTASVPSDRRLTMPDMSKLTVSSVAPTIDKFKQWSRSAYKCTKQTIYEKLGKTTRTVDVELDTQIEVGLRTRGREPCDDRLF